MKCKAITLLFFVVGIYFYSPAQSFVYHPKNPAFGGNYLNYQWMLSSAEAQNKLKEETSEDMFDPYESDPLAEFADDLNRRILSELSRALVYDYFGDDKLQAGKYQIGDYEINITDGSEGLNVRIYDFKSGGETTVVIPEF